MLHNLSKRLDNQCNVIYSTIDRRNEFKTNQSLFVKNFRKMLRIFFFPKEIESFWKEFHASPEDLRFYEYSYFKIYNKKPTKEKMFLNTNVSKNTWKTPFCDDFQTIHPPMQEIFVF